MYNFQDKSFIGNRMMIPQSVWKVSIELPLHQIQVLNPNNNGGGKSSIQFRNVNSDCLCIGSRCLHRSSDYEKVQD